MGKRYTHPNQLDLFNVVEDFIHASDELWKGFTDSSNQADGPAFDSTGELYHKENEAVKEAIRKSGLSRAEVVDRVNAVFGRPGNGERPLGLPMFNNYLSNAKSEKLPLWIVVGVSLALDDPGPMQPMVEATGHTLISEIERIDLEIGRHECAQRELARSKAALRKHRQRLGRKQENVKSESN